MISKCASIINTLDVTIVLVETHSGIWVTIIKIPRDMPDHDEMFEEWCVLVYQIYITGNQIEEVVEAFGGHI